LKIPLYFQPATAKNNFVSFKHCYDKQLKAWLKENDKKLFEALDQAIIFFDKLEVQYSIKEDKPK